MSKKNPTIAICYDFDGTLIPGNMQENTFIPKLDMDKQEFWSEVKKLAENQDMDEVLAYMHLMIKKADEKNVKFKKKDLENHGRNQEFFPGVEAWFNLIKEKTKELNIKIDHYIISSGIDLMIKGSQISNHFKHIFASGFSYDANNVPNFPARSVNYTTKTQYLFRINKGILNSWDNSINKFTPEEERPQPFSRMIYLGDGETDVPAMKTVNYNGGYSIGVYPPKKGKRVNKEEKKKKEMCEDLHKNNRIQFIAEANYSENSPLYNLVISLLERIANETKFDMNLNA